MGEGGGLPGARPPSQLPAGMPAGGFSWRLGEPCPQQEMTPQQWLIPTRVQEDRLDGAGRLPRKLGQAKSSVTRGSGADFKVAVGVRRGDGKLAWGP